MSANEQRMKGQGTQGGGHNGIGRGYLKLPPYCQFGTVQAPVTNGSKDPINDEEFDSWRSQQQNYSTPISASSMADPYTMPSYYGMSYPYQNLGIGGDGPWSNGGDPMTFLSGYGGQMANEQHSHYMDGMFGGFNQPGFNYFHGNGDYSAWGNTAAVGRKPSAHGPYEDYYRDVYGDQVMDRSLKPVEQGLQGLSIVDKDGKQELKGMENSSIPKKMSWASVASQPAKLHPKTKSPPMLTGKHNMDIGTWDSKNGNNSKAVNMSATRVPWSAPRGRAAAYGVAPPANAVSGNPNLPQHPILDKLRQANDYNPKEFDLNPKGARFFIIKSYSEDDIHRSIKYSIWCSTDHGNKRLDVAYRETKGQVYLFYSVNGSGHFCGMAQMVSELDYNASSGVWAQDKWKGEFKVKWIYVKDVPNSQLRHIRLENNENKPVTNSRDTQEVPYEKGKQVLKILHNYRHTTSIFDDFVHYEKRQEEEDQARQQEEQ